ncbi:unnamed protein product [Adineta ricciae]|uniref:Uncharacterized protein n=1 Tax=Adineta ricciae TaxID=249248 RepID=A0A815RT44_ADIRI|nr:unnamed protein product [Adineta ricciae]
MGGSVPDQPNHSSSSQTMKGLRARAPEPFFPFTKPSAVPTQPPEPLISKRRPEGFRPIPPEPSRMSTHRGRPSRYSADIWSCYGVICWAEYVNEIVQVASGLLVMEKRDQADERNCTRGQQPPKTHLFLFSYSTRNFTIINL